MQDGFSMDLKQEGSLIKDFKLNADIRELNATALISKLKSTMRIIRSND